MAGRQEARRNAQQPQLFGDVADEAAPAQGAARLLLIDGTALAYRSYFALKRLSTSRGVPTNAVYGFTRALLELLRDAGPQGRVAVAFDAPGPTFRRQAYEEYKAQRPSMPADLPQQLGIIRHLLDVLGVPRFEQAGVEADDLLATLAQRGVADGYQVEIVTSDRDALQLVSDKVKVRTPDAAELLGPAQVLERYGVRPDQWVDYRALTGDPSDNIPGVPGIGPVAARNLLARYGSLDAVLEELDEVQPERHARLIKENLKQLELARHLSQLLHDVDLAVVPGFERGPVAEEELKELLRSLEFGSVLRQLGLTEAVLYEPAPFGQLLEELPSYQDQGAAWAYGFVLDDARPTQARIVELALAAVGRVGTAAPPFAAQLSGSVNAVDAKALVVAARGAGAAVEPGDDPQLMAYLLDAVTGGVEGLARRLGAGEWGDSAESRAVVGAELLALLRPQLEGPLLRIYQEIERPLQGVLAEMELAGIRLDLSALQRLKDEVAARMSQVEAQLKLVADDDSFNVASRDQVAQLLFQKLGLRGGRRTSTGKLSTAVGALEPLIGQHDAVDLILEHRELAKLHGTYIAPLAELADGQGRVHTTFLQTVVATGRLASVNPNLQSIPVRTPLGREVRRAFIASPGYKLLVADYSQIELRVLAHLTAEPALIDAFTRGEDIHSATAQAIYGVAADAVTPDLRRIAKTINFGILYGMGPQRLARELSLPYAQAERFIATYFARYPNVRRFIDETLARGRELGYVETLLGRRRSVLELQSPDRGTREAAERMTFNMPVQGSAADIVKLAMLRLAPALAERGGLLLLQVHDEVVAEVPERAADQLAQQVRHIMAEVYPLRVPLAARVGVGANWLEAG